MASGISQLTFRGLEMQGGTTFYFVTDGLDSALARAKDAAQGKGVRIGGGVSVIHQCLVDRKNDEMHLAVSPVLLGEGEHLFAGLNLAKLGMKVAGTLCGEKATHVFLARK